MFGHSSGKRGRLSKADLDTGWSTEDERQCSLCQKYGDLKPNVSEGAVGVCKYNTIFFFIVSRRDSHLFTGSRKVAVPGPE